MKCYCRSVDADIGTSNLRIKQLGICHNCSQLRQVKYDGFNQGFAILHSTISF